MKILFNINENIIEMNELNKFTMTELNKSTKSTDLIDVTFRKLCGSVAIRFILLFDIFLTFNNWQISKFRNSYL